MDKNKDLIIEETFNLAVKNHTENNTEVAQNLYKEVLEIDPSYVTAHNNLGAIFNELRDFQKARLCYEKVIEIDPTYAMAYYNLGVVCNKLRDFQKAIICYEKAIEFKPNYVMAHYNLGVIYLDLDERLKAISYFEKAIEVDPKHVNSYNNLGLIFSKSGDVQKAISYFEKAIKIDPKHGIAHNNLGLIFSDSRDVQKAISYFEKAIEIDSNSAEAHCNLGVMFSDLGKRLKAKSYFEKAIEIDPNHIVSLYNCGVNLFLRKQYKDAAEQFKLINFKNSKSFLLKCLYKLDNKSAFLKELDDLIKKGEINAIIGSLSYCSEIKYGIKRLNPFCGDPLKYVLKKDLIEQHDFENVCVKPIKNILKERFFSLRQQTLLTNGYQTAGNLFTKNNNLLKKIEDIIHLEVEQYKDHFKDSNEGLIKSWPNSYNIKAWLVSMKSGGKLDPHMHELGWLSGSIYINVPPKLKTDSGNLVVCVDDQKIEVKKNINQKKIIDVVTGSLCLFPSSLYHYTIPFESKEERIVLAFDLIPD